MTADAETRSDSSEEASTDETSGPPGGTSSEFDRCRDRALARWFSLAGVVPLGIFLVVHAALNALALQSEAAYVTWQSRARSPLAVTLEVFVVIVPLVVHGALGTWFIVTRRSIAPSPYPRALALAMRATALVVFAFLVLHVMDMRAFALMGAATRDIPTALASRLSETRAGVPWRALAYLVGIACSAFHFAGGVWGVLTRARPSNRARIWATGAIGAILALVFANIVVFWATGAPLLGHPPTESLPTPPCPPPPSG
jgi:succinate dehydrogenase / fumarate reductase cytochrome b subunit